MNTEKPTTIETAEAKPDCAPSGCYVVAGKGKLNEGQEYEVRHSRKGTFTMRVTQIAGEWITGVITKGVASAVMSYNVKDVGEEITIRDSHSYFIPVGKIT